MKPNSHLSHLLLESFPTDLINGTPPVHNIRAVGFYRTRVKVLHGSERDILKVKAGVVLNLFKPSRVFEILRCDGEPCPKMIAAGGGVRPKMAAIEGRGKWNTCLLTLLGEKDSMKG